MRTLFNLIKSIIKLIFKIISILWERFLNLNPYEKVIIFLILPAMIVNALPVVSYRIFGGTNYVFNPFAIYMIGIVMVILGTYYIPAKYGSTMRIFTTSAYCISLIVLHAGKGIIRTPYSLTIWFYLNICIVLAFAVLSFLSFIKYERDKQTEF